MANERQRQELNPGLLPLAQYSLPSPVPPQHKCLTPARGACEEGRFQGSHLGWQELTKELTVLQPQSLKVGLLGTEGDYGLLSHPVMLHQRLTRSWPLALGPSTQWAEQNMSCAVLTLSMPPSQRPPETHPNKVGFTARCNEGGN